MSGSAELLTRLIQFLWALVTPAGLSNKLPSIIQTSKMLSWSCSILHRFIASFGGNRVTIQKNMFWALKLIKRWRYHLSKLPWVRSKWRELIVSKLSWWYRIINCLQLLNLTITRKRPFTIWAPEVSLIKFWVIVPKSLWTTR